MVLRKPIITVLGHVDHGKTTLLDSIRGTSVTAKEPGAITQHIGATEISIDLVKKISGRLLAKYGFNLAIPGLLFIDTPGHEAFTNLRRRGGSIADLAILVVDCMQGIQPQTKEAIDILRVYKTPFIIAMNKIDLIQGWNSGSGSFSLNLANQHPKVAEALDRKTYELVGELHSLGFSTERFDRVSDFTKQISIIPCSAKTGEGIPEILLFLSGLSQKFLEGQLRTEVSGSGKGTILEVKEEKGLGKTIDVILYDGSIKLKDKIVLAGRNGIIETQVKALLEPTPLGKNAKEKFVSVSEASAATGIKISAPGLEDALAGSPVLVEADGNERETVAREIGAIRIETEIEGAIVKADTLGSLEALIKLLGEKKVPIRRANVGEVSRNDVMLAIAVSKSRPLDGVIFAFNVKVRQDAEEEAESKGIKIFSSNVVYRIIEEYAEWKSGEEKRQKEEARGNALIPFKAKVLPNCIFHNSKPAVVGVRVIAGIMKPKMAVANNGKKIGTIEQLQDKGKNLKEASAGMEVAASISGAVCGRNLNENDELYSWLSESRIERINAACDLLSDEERKLIEEIKKKMPFPTGEGER
ncbi:MAG: translation initiation factor IF-2 [archaeon]